MVSLKSGFSGSNQFRTQKETPPFPEGFLDDLDIDAAEAP